MVNANNSLSLVANASCKRRQKYDSLVRSFLFSADPFQVHSLFARAMPLQFVFGSRPLTNQGMAHRGRAEGLPRKTTGYDTIYRRLPIEDDVVQAVGVAQ